MKGTQSRGRERLLCTHLLQNEAASHNNCHKNHFNKCDDHHTYEAATFHIICFVLFSYKME